MDESARRNARGGFARYAFHGFGAPVGAHVAEHHAAVGQQVAEEHGQAVHGVIFGSQDVRLADAVPVERGAHQALREVEVGLVVGPLALSLHAAGNGIVAQGLFLVTHFQQFGIAVHEVADDHHVLHGELPVGVLLCAVLALALAVEGGHGRAREERTVLVVVMAFLRFAVFLYPRHGFLELLGVEDAKVHAAQDFYERYVLGPHAQIFLEEVRIHDGTGDAHAGVAHGKIALAAHGGRGLGGAGEAEDLLGHVDGDGVVVEVLDIVAVNAEGRQALLGVGGQDGGQIDRTRAFGAVEAPDGLGPVGIHVHGLGAIAPAGRYGNGTADAGALELLLAGGRLGHAADGRVGNDAFYGTSVSVAQVG